MFSSLWLLLGSIQLRTNSRIPAQNKLELFFERAWVLVEPIQYYNVTLLGPIIDMCFAHFPPGVSLKTGWVIFWHQITAGIQQAVYRDYEILSRLYWQVGRSVILVESRWSTHDGSMDVYWAKVFLMANLIQNLNSPQKMIILNFVDWPVEFESFTWTIGSCYLFKLVWICEVHREFWF